MKTINEYFERTYLINLDRRPDRLIRAEQNCAKVGVSFERFAACDGEKENFQIVSAQEIGQLPSYWNRGAAGILQSLIQILKICIKDKIDSVLILEDDIEFHPDAQKLFSKWIQEVPADWETLYFGGNHIQPIIPISEHLGKITYTFTLHCHAIRSSIFELLLSKLSQMRNPADVYYAKEIHSRGASFSFFPNLAYQEASFSNITNRQVNYSFLRTR